MTAPETADLPDPGVAPDTDAPGALPPPTVFAGFSGPDAPAEADMYRCVHCGLCLSSCPTYRVTGLEMESPRGRIALMKAVNEGRVGISERIVSHWEACLNCRACEAVCPSGVPYGRMMERTRAQVRGRRMQSAEARRLNRWLLRGLLGRPWLLRLGARLLWLYQRGGAQAVVRRLGVLRRLPGGLGRMEGQLPRINGGFFGPSRRVYQPEGDGDGDGDGPALKVALLSGCVMPLMQAATMRAAVRTLTRNGCQVAVPPGQGCCGALSLHAGDLEAGRRMARRNIDAMLRGGADRIVTCSAGCGSTMKEYAHLLKDDPSYAEKAQEAVAKTRDITEFLLELPFRTPQAHLERTVTYQDPCHLAHAQGIAAAPRAILRGIPGIELREMENPSLCCGGAGIYPAVQPLLAQRILSRKLDAIAETGAEEVVTANPGCMLQLEQGLQAAGRAAPVRHVVDLLDEAYGMEEEAAGTVSAGRRGRMQGGLEETRAAARRPGRRRGRRGGGQLH